MKLVQYTLRDTSLMLPSDWHTAGSIFCIPGSVASGYQGWAALTVTPTVAAVVTPTGIEIAIPLWAIEDVSVIKVDGVLVEQETSIGPMLTPLPYPHGIEIVYSMETRLRHRARLLTLLATRAHEWASIVRQAAHGAQIVSLAPGPDIFRRSDFEK